jgi:hypothetical protein
VGIAGLDFVILLRCFLRFPLGEIFCIRGSPTRGAESAITRMQRRYAPSSQAQVVKLGLTAKVQVIEMKIEILIE